MHERKNNFFWIIISFLILGPATALISPNPFLMSIVQRFTQDGLNAETAKVFGEMTWIVAFLIPAGVCFLLHSRSMAKP